MNIVLLQFKLSDGEVNRLINEFPQYLFLAPSELTYKNLGKEEWNRVEVIYGNKLTSEDLEKAHQLKWVHSPVPNTNPLCLNEIEKKGNVLVTGTKEENTAQIGEYVLGGVLAYAKNLFHWREADRNPIILWDSKWRDSMWTLRDKTFLQIGLGTVGTEIARLAREFGMRVWGVQDRKTFHPYCHKVFTKSEIHSVLPNADVVCAALPREQQGEKIFKKEEFALMKEDMIFVVVGNKGLIDEGALAETAASTGKFRGILLDAFYQLPVSPNSELWEIDNTLITPEVAPRPKSTEKESYRLFRYNLRQYLHGNFRDMRNIISSEKEFRKPAAP